VAGREWRRGARQTAFVFWFGATPAHQPERPPEPQPSGTHPERAEWGREGAALRMPLNGFEVVVAGGTRSASNLITGHVGRSNVQHTIDNCVSVHPCLGTTLKSGLGLLGSPPTLVGSLAWSDNRLAS